MIKRLWLVVSIAWTIVFLPIGFMLSPEQLEVMFVPWLALPWVVFPALFYLLRFVFTGTFKRRYSYPYSRR